MKILSFNFNHDGSVCYIKDGKLVYSLEEEKDSNPRFSELSYEKFLSILDKFEKEEGHPDVLCLTGNYLDGHTDPHFLEKAGKTPYRGIDGSNDRECECEFNGIMYKVRQISHEKAHIFNAHSMSNFQTPFYALIWEGGLGSFYRIDEEMKITELVEIMEQPGMKYAAPYFIANEKKDIIQNLSHAGKVMALSAFADKRIKDGASDSQHTIDSICALKGIWAGLSDETIEQWKTFPTYKKGVQSQETKNLCFEMQRHIFNTFYNAAKEKVTDRLPLTIIGGCGLNCDWNTMWKDSGLFTDVFVPPCTNDSGIALGGAAEALYEYKGVEKLEWSVYDGGYFIHDTDNHDGFTKIPLDFGYLAKKIASGGIYSWVQGKYEIGPRALGHRSLLAEPFTSKTTDRLNWIKKRESYRPVAPLCLEEDVSDYFHWEGESPFMLFFQKVKDKRLGAVTHVDGTARVQTVTEKDNIPLYNLLKAFKEETGASVLCNTSLNFNGKGFINRMSDLVEYSRSRKLDGFVLNGFMYEKIETSVSSKRDKMKDLFRS